ncbi:hypothetical protein BDY19DRAFT_907806 [Irpex rosettiformis]|uniref:Uncharacterized protein n=1 Tax=Irpex rosettiformis TaxID=378272 RepID=A0ACB8TYM9_9APHY|nr:hypothetical protein BDY19DRAFT_907806 [Irpex rosettiformis]
MMDAGEGDAREGMDVVSRSQCGGVKTHICFFAPFLKGEHFAGNETVSHDLLSPIHEAAVYELDKMLWMLATPLPISPIFKVPLLFGNAASIHACYTPPNPIPDTQETNKYGYKVNSNFRFKLVRRIGAGAKAFHWFYAASESAIILANAFPSELSTNVLSTLMRHPERVSALRITPGWLIGSALMASGALIRMACYRELGRFFTWELSLRKDQNLVTTGPYSIVRHPSYTGTTLATIGTFICQIGAGTWMAESGWFELTSVRVLYAIWLAYSAYIPWMMIWRTYAEDQVLREQFPEEWNAWARRTPYKLIPYIF